MDIHVEHVTKSFGGQKAVADVSFHGRKGEVLGFLGPNGAGKTTTMRMICGLAGPDSGRVLLGGQPMTADATGLRRAIGYLPETNPLYPEMATPDLLRFGARLQGVPAKEVEQRVREAVQACGLEAEKHKRTGELSRGYRQRAGLAMAMVHRPKVLVLDEPTTGLDPNQVQDIRALIKETGKRSTVIFSTHILSEAEAVCDRILIIHKGRIVADGTTEELCRGEYGPVRYTVAIPNAPADAVVATLQAISGVFLAIPLQAATGIYRVEMGTADGGRIAGACAAQGWTLEELRREKNSLEDIFRHATSS